MTVEQILLRADSAAQWTAINPVLALREPGLELDSRRLKIGDGVTPWTSLPYAVAIPADVAAAQAAAIAAAATDATTKAGNAQAAAQSFATQAIATQATADRAAYGWGIHVAAYGAKGDGTTDDTVAIADTITAAKNLAALTGRAIPVRLMAGTHLVRMRPQADNASVYAAIELPSGVHLVGAGRGVTIVKLRSAETNAGHIIHNTALNGGDHDISVSDLTIDGNGANQTQLSQGLSFLRASDITITRVAVRDVYGTDAFPPGETFHFDLDSCVRVTYTDCQAVGTAGTQGSGFGDNSSTDVSYTGCMAVGMSAGMGFASWHGSAISYTGCRAQSCGTNGFNVEYGNDIVFAACIAGGEASDQATGYTYANSASLGNGSSGFTINATVRAVVTGCISRKNGSGISVVPTGAVESSCQIIGGVYSDNTGIGIYFGDPACATNSYVSDSTVVTGNVSANWAINTGVGSFDTVTGVPGPAQASGSVVTNPFPFKVGVYLGTPSNAFFVVVNTDLNLGTPPVVFLRPGDTIQVNYSTSPGFTWMRG